MAFDLVYIAGKEHAAAVDDRDPVAYSLKVAGDMAADEQAAVDGLIKLVESGFAE